MKKFLEFFGLCTLRELRTANRELGNLRLRIGGREDCPQCERLRLRIRRFFEQKKLVKQAYQDRVMLVSHGQVDKRALIEAERYLLVDSDDEIRTFGEIRDAEINRALELLQHSNDKTSSANKSS